jgi:alpha-L-rhamnosidase
VYCIDETWAAHASNITLDDIYDGQTTDLRIANGAHGAHGATDPVEVDSVEEAPFDVALLEAPDGPPVRATEVLPAQRVWRSPSGQLLVDFGQNLVGWCRLKVRNLPAGHTVTLRHAEVLENEELGVRPLRKAKATDTYTLAGDAEESLEPCFTFHGFRYAHVDGVDNLQAADIEAVVVGSDMERTGWFESSHDLLNRFYSNVVWGMRGNFLDVPTDCPQRDERLGWTGDIEVFTPTASFLFDSVGFLTSWLKDLSFDQRADGAVPIVIPDVLKDGLVAAAWGDAATIVPWVLYQRSGDSSVLARQLPSMHAWVRRVSEVSRNGVWAGGFQFGDWLDPSAPPHDALRSKADKDVIATAYLCKSAQILANAAAVVGNNEIAEWARGIEQGAHEGFQREFVTAAGRVLSDAQTVYALALEWDLFANQPQRERAAARLADLVRTSNFCIATGFVGTPLIADALTNNGYADVAYRMLLQTQCPSWLYPVTMGATTVWERWDSMLPDGSINPGEMTSFNHYALGAVADWLHRSVGGLAPADLGFRRLRIAPVIRPGLSFARVHGITPYGEASVGWIRTPAGCTVSAVVPVGVSADVVLPDGRSFEVGHGPHQWMVEMTEPAPIKPQTVREVLDSPETWDRFVDAAMRAELGGMARTHDARSLADRLSAFLDGPIAAIPDILTLGGNDPGRDRFVELLGDLLDP